MTIGTRICELRKAKGFTQEYIAAQLGISRQAVSKWEQDLTSPDTKNLIILAELLGTSIEYIATGNTAPPNNHCENRQFTQQRLLLQQKIDRKMKIVYPLLLGGVLTFFLFTTMFGSIAALASVALISVAIYQLISAQQLRKDLDFLNEAETSPPLSPSE